MPLEYFSGFHLHISVFIMISTFEWETGNMHPPSCLILFLMTAAGNQ